MRRTSAAPVRSRDPGPIVWKRTWVDDRPAAYGVAGDGLPVLFLHGWALGHHTYRGVIQRIAAQGCQVFAPAPARVRAAPPTCPSDEFTPGRLRRAGSTASSRPCGVDEQVVVVGHSFGGGVAIRLAYDYPGASCGRWCS